jgi:hypothetical protein
VAMIKLEKTSKPEVLVKNAANWTTNFLNKIANDTTPTQAENSRYRHPEVKAAWSQRQMVSARIAKARCSTSTMEMWSISFQSRWLPKSDSIGTT